MTERIAGIVLAGGRGTRMGGRDKALLPLGGRPLIAHVLARLGCARAISANGDPARLAAFGLPVLADDLPGFPGPLAGILAGLDWAAGQGFDAIVTAAADTPFLPPDIAARLAATAPASPVVLARGAGGDGRGRDGAGGPRVQPTVGRWSCTLAGPLRAALTGGERRVEAAARALGCAFCDVPGTVAFLNINTPEELAAAEALQARHGGT